MSAIENVSLVREQSNPAVYLIVGGTKFWITDPAEFDALGFDWGKVRTVVDGSLAGFTQQLLHAGPATRPSDVFFDCTDSYDLFKGKFYGNCKPSAAIVRKDVLVAGWFWHDEPYPFVNYSDQYQGTEDIHYNIFLDAVFADRMYGPDGLSAALSNVVWPGNPSSGSPPGPVQIPFATSPPLTPGGPPVVTFNSWILPTNQYDVHGELNVWHVSDTNPGLATSHWRGRGPAPPSWIQQDWQKYPLWQTIPDSDNWFPFDPLDPEALGRAIQNSDYILMRGTIWQENNHGLNQWSRPPTIGQDGYTEMHPPDWIVRVRPPNPNARITTWYPVPAPASPDVTGPPITIDNAIWPDFAASAPTAKLQVRTVQQLIDLRFTDPSTIVAVDERTSTDHVDVHIAIQPGGGLQARFKGAWLVGWSEIDELDEAWVDDQTPPGATLAADNETWDWEPGNVFSGSLAHRSALKAGMHQHYFYGAATPIISEATDKPFATVFLDPDNPPDEVMLQWHTTDWLSRAYWGANLLDWGTDGTSQRRYMGPLPPSGEWVRLSVLAQDVGIDATKPIDGMAFTLYGGRATWDYAGVNKASTVLPPPKSMAVNLSLLAKSGDRRTIQVTVTDAATNDPLSGATIKVLDNMTGAVKASGVTNQSGTVTVTYPWCSETANGGPRRIEDPCPATISKSGYPDVNTETPTQ
jgi:hypothetical protein